MIETSHLDKSFVTMIRVFVELADSRLYFNEYAENDDCALTQLSNRFCSLFREVPDYHKRPALDLVIQSMVNETDKRCTYEKTIDFIIEEAFEQDIIPASLMMYILVNTCDFTLATTFNSRKIDLIRERLHLLDYKGVRSLFKQLIVKMIHVPSELSKCQLTLLVPVAQLMIAIMERDSNVLPALFAATEINTISNKKAKVSMFPRIMDKASEMENSFRMLAELSYVTDRTYLFPIPSHCGFLTTSPLWKIDPLSTHMLHRLHLPFKGECYSPQHFLLFVLMKQHKGKDYLGSIFRSTTNTGPAKAALDNILITYIMEVMMYMERCPTTIETPSFIWDNIIAALHYSFLYGWCEINRFVNTLCGTIKRSSYKKGRDELMWTLLQTVVHYERQSNHSSPPLSTEGVNRIVEIYSCLYQHTETFVVSELGCRKLVKKLACACIWIELNGVEGLPPPSGQIKQYIDFIHSSPKDNAQIALIANSYAPGFEQNTNALMILIEKIKCKNSSTPLEDNVLCAIGIRSQRHLLHLLLQDMKNDCGNNIMPSAAQVETISRLACMLDSEQGQKQVTSQLAKSIRSGTTDDEKVVYILTEIIGYRTFNISYKPRSNTIVGAFTRITNNIPFTCKQYEEHSMLECLIFRLWSWVSPFDSYLLFQNIILDSLKRSPKHQLLDVPPYIHYKHTPFPYDLSRSLFITFLRMAKFIGQDIPADIGNRISNSYYFPESQLISLHSSISPTPNNFYQIEADAFTQFKELVHREYTQMNCLPEYTWNAHFSQVIRSDHPVFFCAYFRFLYQQNLNNKVDKRTVLSLIDGMDVSRIIACTIALVDYLIHEGQSQVDTEEFFSNVSNTLIDLLLIDEIIPLDRFFFTAAYSPRSDKTSLTALSLIRALVSHSSFKERINNFHSNVPRPNSPDFINRLNHFKKQSESCGMTSCLHGHSPSYYGHPFLKILSSTDALIERALQLNIDDEHFMTLINCLSPLYKYHPFPLTYCLTLISPLYQILLQRPGRGRKVVESLIEDHYKLPPIKSTPYDTALSLTNLLITTFDIGSVSEYRLECDSSFPPFIPDFIRIDWKTCELTPIGQILYCISCVLLTSDIPSIHMGNAFIEVLYCQEDVKRPLLYLNAVSLILTSLPFSYSSFLFDQIMDMYSSDELENITVEELVLDSYSSLCLSHRVDRLSAVIALSQSFWHHATTPTLISFVGQFEESLKDRVKTEKELFYTLHILIPLLQRIADTKEKSHIDRCFRMVVLIYTLLLQVCQSEPLEREDTICDLLYLFKYVFVGDSVKGEINELISRMPYSLQTKLKFIVAPVEGRHMEDIVERKDSL